MLETIKKHWFVVIPAFIIGIIIVLPNITSVLKTGDTFAGIYPMFNDDESYYLAITKEVYDGRVDSGNAFLAEHSKDKPMQPLFFELIPAYEAKLLNLTIPQTFVLNDFLLPFITVLLLYFLLFSINQNRFISALLSFLYFFSFLYSFNRPISPQLGFPFFLIGILLIWGIIKEIYSVKKFLILQSSLSILFVSLIYIYPFYWTSIVTLYFLGTFSIMIKSKNFSYWIKGYLFFGMVTLVLMVPYIFSVLDLMKSSFFIESSIRNGLVFTHYPGAFVNVFFVLFCLLILFLSISYFQNSREKIFCYSLILSSIILNWQNVITGKVLQFSSHYYMVTVLFVFLILSICIKNLLPFSLEDFKNNNKKLSVLLLTFFLVLIISYIQKVEFIGAFKIILHPENITYIQKIKPAIDWINGNTPKGSVFYTLGDEFEKLIPIYTDDYVYRSYYSSMSLVSDDELENRWVVNHYWENIDENIVKESQRDIWLNKFQDTYAHKEVLRKIAQIIIGDKYPESFLADSKYTDNVLKKVAKFKNEGFEKSLKFYKVDYVILNSTNYINTGLESKLKEYAFLQKVFNERGILIYKVN